MSFNQFPYSNLHNLNLDWILATLKAMVATVEQAQGTISGYESRLEAAETAISQIGPPALGAVRHDVSQALDAENRRRAVGNIHAVSHDAQLLDAAQRAQVRSNIQAVSYEEQELTSYQQAQARENIGAISSGDIPPAQDAVLYTEQQLTSAQQEQARENIGAASQTDMSAAQAGLQRSIRWDVQQLTDAQKQQARANIGAVSSGDIPPAQDAVLYTAQQLTAAQQRQARQNIGAAGVYTLIVAENELQTGYEVSGSVAEAAAALDVDKLILVQFQGPVTIDVLPRLQYTGNQLTGLQAEIVISADASSPMPNMIYRITITDSNGQGQATVEEIEQRQVPVPDLILDQGKVLTVGSNGRAVWNAPAEPLVVTFSGSTEENDAACDKTWAQIIAAPSLILRYVDERNVCTYLAEKIVPGLNITGTFNGIDIASRDVTIQTFLCAIDSSGSVEVHINNGVITL